MLANIWHWWIGVILFAVSALAVAGLVVGYVRKVSMPRYPRRDQRAD